MDPLTAVSLASAIIQFIDYGTRLMRDASEMYHSTTGSTAQNESLELITTEINGWSSKLATTGIQSTQSDEEKGICRLATQCQKLSSDILGFVQKVRPKDQKSKIKVALSALKGRWYQKDILELQERLNDCGRQLNRQLQTLDRSNAHNLSFIEYPD
jgi:hypothetical protein